MLSLCKGTPSPSGLPLFQPTCLPLGRKDGCCHWSNGLTSHLIVKVHNIGVCGIQWPIWLESTLFTVQIKLCFHTSYLGSFLNKAWCHRVTMMSLFSTCRVQNVYRDRQKPANGTDALLLWHIARDLLHAFSHRHDYTWTTFVEPVI